MVAVSERVGKLCAAAGFGGDGARCVDMVERLVEPALASPRGWRSEVADDGSPVELSIALVGQRIEVRVLFEPQGRDATVAGQRAAALAFCDRIASLPGVDLTRYRRLSDLLLPAQAQGPFALWSSIVFAAGEAPSFKAYFNAQAHGAAAASDVVEEALHRLDLPHAMDVLRARALRRGRHDEIKYVALDLTRSPSARVKVYVRHHQATAQDLEVTSLVPHARSGAARDFVVAMCRSEGPLLARAPATCHAFVAGAGPDSVVTTVYVPVCAYAHDDAVARSRLRAYMQARDIDAQSYERLLAAFATRPLDAGVGMQSWFALRRHAGRPRLTIYLSTEARGVFAPGSVPAPTQLAGGR